MGRVRLSLPGATLSSVSGTQKIVADASPAALTLKIFVDGTLAASANNASQLQYLWDTTVYMNGTSHPIRAEAAYKTGSDLATLNPTVNNAGSGGGGGGGATLTLSWEGMIRDKVSLNAATPDGAMDGVFKATLSGSGKTVTSLSLVTDNWSFLS